MLTLFFALIATLLPPAQAERPQMPRDHVYTVGGEARFYNSSANYRSDGTSQTLLSGASFQNTQAEVNLAYEMARRWRFFADLSYAQTQASDGTTTHTLGGIDEFGLGAQYWFKPGPFFVVPQLRTVYPFTRMDEGGNNALIGDGNVRLEGGAYAIWRLAAFQPFAYAGYVKRDAGRADLFNYEAGLYWRPNSFYVQGSYRGYTSVTRDSESDADGRGLRDIYLTRVSGGSYRYDSVNPSLGEAVVVAGYHVTRAWNAYASYAMSLNGSSAANGWTALAGFTYSALIGHPAPATAAEEAPDTSQFRPANDKYDESLFQEDKNGKGNVKRRVRKNPSVDKLLNETEKELNFEEPEN